MIVLDHRINPHFQMAIGVAIPGPFHNAFVYPELWVGPGFAGQELDQEKPEPEYVTAWGRASSF